MSRILFLILTLVLLIPGMGVAGELLPAIPAAKGEQCVEPTDVMRKNHMNFILHQRDETMYKGIRTKQHSLKECIDCHVLPNAEGTYPALGSSEHFCVSCHKYAAVKVDCFQCHSGVPESAITHSQLKSSGSAHGH